MKTRLVVLAKSPEPGRVKTRLTPPLSPVQAAAVARAALQDTLRAVLLAGGRTPPLLALAGPPGTWLPGGFEVVRQQGDGLDERIAAPSHSRTGADAHARARVAGRRERSDLRRPSADPLESRGSH